MNSEKTKHGEMLGRETSFKSVVCSDVFFPFFCSDVLRYNLKKTKRKIRENNEHLVPRPFTSNNNGQINIPPKHIQDLSDVLKHLIELEGNN